MPRNATDFIVIHCADTYADMDTSAKDIDRWHRARGWLKIGYHYVVRRDGHVEAGRGLYDVGAHASGYNTKSLGICMIGGKSRENDGPENNFTPAQFAATALLLETLHAHFPDAKVVGHNEISTKACPSFDVQKWLRGEPDISLAH